MSNIFLEPERLMTMTRMQFVIHGLVCALAGGVTGFCIGRVFQMHI